MSLPQTHCIAAILVALFATERDLLEWAARHKPAIQRAARRLTARGGVFYEKRSSSTKQNNNKPGLKMVRGRHPDFSVSRERVLPAERRLRAGLSEWSDNHRGGDPGYDSLRDAIVFRPRALWLMARPVPRRFGFKTLRRQELVCGPQISSPPRHRARPSKSGITALLTAAEA